MSRKVIRTLIELKEVFNKLVPILLKEPIIIEVEKLINKRTDKQLRTVWMLISIITLYFRDNGNNYTAEEVMNYFKIESGLYKEINNVKIPLSISDKAKRTKKEMNNLIECILKFGAENNIDNCYLNNEEILSILDNYKD